jgi:hypothetical protein
LHYALGPVIDNEDRQVTAQPQRVGASRTPALVVLIGASAILFTFAVVLPRLTPPTALSIGSPAAAAAPLAPASESVVPFDVSPPPSSLATDGLSATPTLLPSPPVVVAVVGGWGLAPGEQPNPRSTELNVEILDYGCDSGLTDPDQIQEPFIAYEETAVSIVFSLLVERRDDCAPGVIIPITVELSEPLGDRDLVDGGSGDLRFDSAGQFAVFPADPEVARDHALANFPDACVTTVSLEGDFPSYRQLNRMSRRMPVTSGAIDHGRAYQGSWEQAARYFGAVEVYRDEVDFEFESGHSAILAPASRLGIEGSSEGGVALVALTLAYTSTGYEIWYPAFLFADFEPASVYSPPPCG